MKASIALRYRRALVLFVLILLLFSLIANGLLIAHQRGIMLEQSKANTDRELRLMSVLVREALLKRNYSAAQDFLIRWAQEDREVVELTATAANGFQLVDYKRDGDSIHTFTLQHQVDADGSRLLDLEMVRDFSLIEQGLTRTRIQLLLGTLVFMLLLGRFLWVTVQRLALIPMERIESELRKQQYRLRRLTAQKDKEITRTEKRLAKEVKLRKQQEQVSEQRAQRLVVVQELEHRILEAGSMEDIASLALDHVRRFVACQQALLFWFDEQQEQAVLVAESTPDGAFKLPYQQCSIEGFAGMPVLERGQNHVIQDVLDMKSQSGLDDLLFERRLHSYSALPLRARGRLMGCLVIGSESAISCAGESLDSATEVAELIAIALRDDCYRASVAFDHPATGHSLQ